MRFERKYQIDKSKQSELKIFLISNNFKKIYQERVVSSIYYDTKSLDLYSISEDGEALRNKIRIRFYNFDTKKINLEIKNKNAELGSKTYDQLGIHNVKLIPVHFSNYSNKISNLLIPNKLSFYYYPVVYIQYKRSYFLSRDNDLRLTFDENIIFSKATCSYSKILINKKFFNFVSVIELKYDHQYKPNFNFISELSDRFGLELTRNSKYCNAINSLY